MNGVSGNLWKLKFFHSIAEFLLVMPIIAIFWIENGLSMTQIFLLQSIYAIFVLILEVPTGYFADRFGRRKSLIIGSIFYFLGFLVYGFSYNFWHFVMGESVLAVGLSFISGADSAILYDSLVELKREKEFQKIRGSIFAYTGYAAAIGAVIGGIVASFSLRETFYVQVLVLVLMIPLAISLVEPRTKKFEIPETPKNMKNIIKYSLFEHKEVKWLIIYAGFLFTSTLTMVFFAQPFWKLVGVPLSFFGIIWAALVGVRGLFSHLASRYENLLGRKWALISLIFFPFAGYLLLSLFFKEIWAIGFLVLFQFVYGVATPILEDYLNKIVPSEIRATVLSIQALISRVINALIGPILGYSFDIFSFRETFLLSGAIFFVAGIICLIMLKRHGVLNKV